MKKSISALLLLAATLTAGALPAHAQDPSPTASPDTSASSSTIATTAQEFVNSLVAGDYQSALQRYAPASRVSVTTATLQQTWQDILAESGDFQQISNIRTESIDSESGSSLVIITAQFTNGPRDFFVLFTSDNQIVSIQPVENQQLPYVKAGVASLPTIHATKPGSCLVICKALA